MAVVDVGHRASRYGGQPLFANSSSVIGFHPRIKKNIEKKQTKDLLFYYQNLTSSQLRCLNARVDDVVYLLKAGNGLRKIAKEFVDSPRGKRLFKQEVFILQKAGMESTVIQLNSTAKAYQQWLSQFTNYQDIVSNLSVSDDLAFQCPRQIKEDITKTAIKKIFLDVQYLLKKRNRAVYRDFNARISFIVYLNQTEKKYNLIFHVHANAYKLGEGSDSEVWRVFDLASRRFLAMKWNKKQNDGRGAGWRGCEYTFWRSIGTGHPGIMQRPEIFIKKTRMVGKLYHGDVIDLLNIYNEGCDSSLRQVVNESVNINPTMHTVLTGILNVLKGLLFLSQHEISHGDIKHDNLFIEVQGTQINIVAGDFSRAISYEKVIAEGIYPSHLFNLREIEDLHMFIVLLQQKDAVELKKLVQAMDVYAIGKVIMQILMGRDAEFCFKTEEVAGVFELIYGKALLEFCKAMCMQDYTKRLTFVQAVDSLSQLIESNPRMLKRRFKMTTAQFFELYEMQRISNTQKTTYISVPMNFS
jgi:hypothetical protein